jgi:hypothetical protein
MKPDKELGLFSFKFRLGIATDGCSLKIEFNSESLSKPEIWEFHQLEIEQVISYKLSKLSVRI